MGMLVALVAVLHSLVRWDLLWKLNRLVSFTIVVGTCRGPKSLTAIGVKGLTLLLLVSHVLANVHSWLLQNLTKGSLFCTVYAFCRILLFSFVGRSSFLVGLRLFHKLSFLSQPRLNVSSFQRQSPYLAFERSICLRLPIFCLKVADLAFTVLFCISLFQTESTSLTGTTLVPSNTAKRARVLVQSGVHWHFYLTL